MSNECVKPEIPQFPELTFEEERHLYYLNGLEVPSVTTLRKPLSSDFYSTVDPEVLNKAAKRGTAIHNAVIVRKSEIHNGANYNFTFLNNGTLNNGAKFTVGKVGQSFEMKQYQRLEGVVDLPASVVVKQLEIKVLDAAGKLQASEVARM